MPLPVEPDLDACCFLKQHLEPRFRVVAEPSTDYFSEWQCCYRIFDGVRLLHELLGGRWEMQSGTLISAAREIVATLEGETSEFDEHCDRRPSSATSVLPMASRLPPERTDTTYFSSGRAAFAYLVGQVVRPRCMYLPTLVCWSLISAMQRRFPDTELRFYTVDRHLNCQFPDSFDDDSALVFIHYFGHRTTAPERRTGLTLLEDLSHLPLRRESVTGDYAFGSLRKVYRTADGGFVKGSFNPVYEPTRKSDAWLRLEAVDWRDMREAENMTDRAWAIADISSQSLAVVLSSDGATLQQQRQAGERFLSANVPVGRPLVCFGDNDCPLLHNRLLDSREQRDSLRSFLAARGIFCSIHWPTHSHLLKRQDAIDVTDAVWLENHILSIPLWHHFGERELEAICKACHDWQVSGV